VRSYSGGVRHDYKDSSIVRRSLDLSAVNRRGLSWFALGLILPLVAVVLLLVSEPNESMVPTAADIAPLDGQSLLEDTLAAPKQPLRLDPSALTELALLLPGERVRLSLPEPVSASANQAPRPDELARLALLTHGEPLTMTVRKGDTLDRMFRRNDLSISDLAAMVDLPEAERELTRIHVGDKIEVIHDSERVLSLTRAISDTQELWIRRDGEGFAAEVVDLDVEIRTAGAHGVIDSSLWLAATAAGLDPNIIEKIDNIFEWDIDFMLEVRSGDSFTVVYEELWRDGEKVGNGDIVAAEFVNQGKTYRAARYIDADGNRDYYTPEGLSVRRPFLRNPIEFTRVSSTFNPNRRHPILNTIRAHRGVDLAAPTGTPVRAAGDGKIIALGTYGSFGKRVEIQHGGGVTTLYAHLNGYGEFRQGDRVSQGQVIGYVGMTGSATGPHLHYEYRLNGVHQNPQTVDLPAAEPIDPAYLGDFRVSTAGLWHQLDLFEGTRLASTSD
jgi:murein DD-endopeptidase MepM/ murein hydrolase activator NlpD